MKLLQELEVGTGPGAGVTGAGIVVGGANGAGVGGGVGAATGAGVVVPIVTDATAGLAERLMALTVI